MSTTAGSPQRKVVLSLNSGSSSLKLGVFRVTAGEPWESTEAVLSAAADGIGTAAGGSLHVQDAQQSELHSEKHTLHSQEEALAHIADVLQQHLPGPLDAVGHRVVHGGPHLRQPVLVDSSILQQLRAAEHLAPLHVPVALALLQAAERTFPGIPQVACFDTAFHRTMPDSATHLPVPAELFVQGVQRYGFHGLSCESVMARLGPVPPRLIIAHLGGGSSLTAVRDGQSINNTMGLSPAGGLPMGVRSGDLDPGVLLWLQRNRGLGVDQLETLVNHACGMQGLAGESDMRALMSRRDSGDAAAKLAVEIFTIAVRQAIGAYAALLGGLDLLIFTGGIGEHADTLRREILQGLHFLAMDDPARVRTLPAQEEQVIARHAVTLV